MAPIGALDVLHMRQGKLRPLRIGKKRFEFGNGDEELDIIVTGSTVIGLIQSSSCARQQEKDPKKIRIFFHKKPRLIRKVTPKSLPLAQDLWGLGACPRTLSDLTAKRWKFNTNKINISREYLVEINGNIWAWH